MLARSHRCPSLGHAALLAPSLLLAAPAFACDDVWEWLDFEVENISTVSTSGGVETQLIIGHSGEWGEVWMRVCSDDLIPGVSMTSTCEAEGFLDTAIWASIWQNEFSGATGNISGSHPTYHPRGIFTGTTSYGELIAKRVEQSIPVCGKELRLAPYKDILPDNIGMGLATFDGALEDHQTFFWSGTPTLPGCTSGAVCDADVFTVATTGSAASTYPWMALNIGNTLPTDPFDSAQTLSTTGYHRPVGTLAPSRVAYGRIQWDHLWHGTCDDDPAQWCLPAGHPRIDGTVIVAAESCGGGTPTCNMGCPGDPGVADADEVKYDFDLLLDFIERAHDDGVAIPTREDGSGGHATRISQRAALRIMPWSDYRWQDGSDAWHRSLSVPSFVTESCDAEVVRSGTVGPTAVTSGQEPWVYVEPRDPVYRDQLARLVDALVGEASGIVQLSSSHSAYFTDYGGLDHDARVFSVDIGAAGTYGEWNLAAPNAYRPGDVDVGNFRLLEKVFFANTPDLADVYDADTDWYDGLPPGDTGLWDPDCLDVTPDPDRYALRPHAWWSRLHEIYTSQFPFANGYPSTHLVGKVFATRSAVFPPVEQDPDVSDGHAAFCYRPEEFTVGRRSVSDSELDPVYDADLYDYINNPTNLALTEEVYPAEAPQTGVRFDSWGVANIQAGYPTADETRYALASDAWKVSSFQAEIADTLPELVSEARTDYGPASDTPYGIWDLDETVRYSVAGRFSLFNLKGAPIPQEETQYYTETATTPPPNAQRIETDFCECHDDWDGDDSTFGACVVSELDFLLRNTGFRIYLKSRSYRGTVETSEVLRTLTRFRNLGNVPPLSEYKLQFAFVDRADFDIPPVSSNSRKVLQYPHVAFAPPTGTDLSDVLINLTTVPLSTFDPRTLLPREDDLPLGTWDPGTQVSYDTLVGSPTCQEQANDESLLGDGQTAEPHDFGSSDESKTFYEVEVDLTAPSSVSTAGYVILYRLADTSQDDLDAADQRPVHMDLMSSRRVGDATQARWYFYGYLNVEAP